MRTTCCYYPPRSEAKFVAAKAQVIVLQQALECYRSDVGAYPSETQGLQALRTDPGVTGWSGPYVTKDIPRDPWGVPYEYRLAAGRPLISSSRRGL